MIASADSAAYKPSDLVRDTIQACFNGGGNPSVMLVSTDFLGERILRTIEAEGLRQDVLVRMNRLGFRLQGDMNWHNHAGIKTYPIQMAARHKIPLIFWGEYGWMDLGASFQFLVDALAEQGDAPRIDARATADAEYLHNAIYPHRHLQVKVLKLRLMLDQKNQKCSI